MPVILHPADFALWRDPGIQDPEAIRSHLRAYPDAAPVTPPVRRFLNNPQDDGPACVAPLAGGAG